MSWGKKGIEEEEEEEAICFCQFVIEYKINLEKKYKNLSKLTRRFEHFD